MKQSKFYVYKITDDYYLTIDGLKLGKTKKLNSCAYFTSEKNAKSWLITVLNKYPGATLKEAELSIKS